MPILDVDHAKSIVVIKRSMGRGYAGIDNSLYTDPKTGMLFSDAKAGLEKAFQLAEDNDWLGLSGSFWYGLFHISSIILGQHRNLAGVESVRARHLRIESGHDVPFQIDGDPGGELPVDIEVLPGRLSMLIPRKWWERISGAERLTLGQEHLGEAG